MTNQQEERLTERRVTYTLEMDGQVYIVENVPARIDEQSGEQFFAPATVERLRETIRGQRQSPKRFARTPVYEFV